VNKVPSNRYAQTKMFGSGFQEPVVVRSMPAPPRMDDISELVGERPGLVWAEEWNEIRSHSKSVSGLVHTSFRDTFFQSVKLPHGIAESLKDFEKGLRLAGLVGPDEVLVQQASRPPKFRVEKADISDDCHNGQSFVDCSERATHSAVESENQQKATTPYRRGKRLSSGRYEA